jgi:hypothetical protein
MMKTTFFKYGFLTVKYHKKGGKHHLLGEKDRDKTAQKIRGGNGTGILAIQFFYRSHFIWHLL